MTSNELINEAKKIMKIVTIALSVMEIYDIPNNKILYRKELIEK